MNKVKKVKSKQVKGERMGNKNEIKDKTLLGTQRISRFLDFHDIFVANKIF
jgi:hypothetical protein